MFRKLKKIFFYVNSRLIHDNYSLISYFLWCSSVSQSRSIKQVVQRCNCCRQYFKDLMSSGGCFLLTMQKQCKREQCKLAYFCRVQPVFAFLNAKLQHLTSVFKHIHSRSKTVQKQWDPRTSRSFPFTTVQRFYGRTSRHPLDVRPYPLTPYVHRPFERTSIAPLVVRP